MNNYINQVPFLRTSREFPTEAKMLTQEVNKCYVDIANAVNSRTIGIFPTVRPAVTGDSYFLSNNRRQQAVRQVYNFGTISAGDTLQIAYNIGSFVQFSRIYGTCITANPDYRPIPYASTTDNANIELYVDSANINIIVGSASPNITSGIIILEWLSEP